MSNIQIIHRRLLDEVASQAQAASRRRKNHNFHATDSAPCHRLLNAIEPDSYIQPHCHRQASKDETLLIVKGRVGLIIFDERGDVSHKVLLVPLGEAVGADIPHGVFHTLVALDSGSVFFEAKAGPYVALSADEKASWAPAEGDPQAAVYLARWQQLFS
ncbi:MAG: WbuC family cupin fold metalloprotein [Sulfuricaulis sp.]